MGWLASLFSPQTSQSSRKGQAMSSTHEAFSIPTSSPIPGSHQDAFNPDGLGTPDAEAMSPSYSYPPKGSGSYGYVPTSAGLHSRPAPLLPTHHDPLHRPLSPTVSYPPLSHTWNRIRTWLSREYPELGDTLNYGILPQDLAQIEMQFGFALPAAIRQSYLVVDGQEAESAAGCSEGLFFGLVLLPLDEVLEEWRFWREVDEDPTTGANARLQEVMQSIPPQWVRREYSQRGWIPLITDKAGNYVGVDLNPGESGSIGQVIVFGRDFDTKVVLWKGDGPAGWAKWLASFVEELESGEGYEIGSGNDVSEESEDDVGFESYFYDGSGRGQGDGGGDSGSGGGLRLTGEYRGWSVLEAWADRSVRKWHEAGLIPDSLPLPDENLKGKITENVGLGVLDLQPDSDVKVPISALVDDNEAIPSAPALDKTTNNSRRSPPGLPTISITKPPAPLPVELPTPHDIEHTSPQDSKHSSYDDLESGTSRGMREIQDTTLISSSRRSQTQLPNTSSSPSTPLSTSPLVNSSTGVGRQSPSPPNIPDLLADSAPALQTTPIDPSSLLQDISLEPQPLADSVDAVDIEAAAEAVDDDAADADTTIRLVGGGGTAGIVDSIPLLSDEEMIAAGSEADLTDAASDSSAKKEKKHKKTRSGLAGLKKLGHFGGLRKRGSSGSVQDATPASSMN